MTDEAAKIAYWAQRWAEGKTGFHRDAVNEHLLAHGRHLSGQRVLVPLAGRTLDILHLMRAFPRVVAIEGAPQPVHEFHREHGITPHIERYAAYELHSSPGLDFLVGDMFDAKSGDLGLFDAIWDRAALIALPPDTRARYAAVLKPLLAKAAKLLIVTVDYDQSKLPGPPFAVPESEVRRHYGDLGPIERLAEKDITDEGPRFREHGVHRAIEQVFLVHVER